MAMMVPHPDHQTMILNALITGAGPPVILLHGLFGSARNFGAHLSRIGVDLRPSLCRMSSVLLTGRSAAW